MDALIEEIVQKLHNLPDDKILEVFNFVELLTWNNEQATPPPQMIDGTQNDAAFEMIADHLADEFNRYVGTIVPRLSDYAISRAGIYEEHP